VGWNLNFTLQHWYCVYNSQVVPFVIRLSVEEVVSLVVLLFWAQIIEMHPEVPPVEITVT
jgi:hypothetical protein